MDFNTIILKATFEQLTAATEWTADQLHLPQDRVRALIAVAYVCKHFEAGQLTGWDGFLTDLKG